MDSAGKKNYLRRNKLNLITLSILVLLLIIGYYNKCIQINYCFTDSDHFNILTINSILAGFLFTGLGILASALDREKIDRLDKNGYLDDYFNGIYVGIACHIISMVASILIIMKILIQFEKYFLYFEQIGLISGTIIFIKSIWGLFKIIKLMRKN